MRLEFDSDSIMADIYDAEVRNMVGAVVAAASGATMLLTRGRTIRKFRAKLNEMSDGERKRLGERYAGMKGKKYQTDSWRGLWDKILDTAYAMDARGNHRSRAMSKYGDFLDVAEAIEARNPDAVPTAIVNFSCALNDIQRKIKNAEKASEREKLLSIVADAFVAVFTALGGVRRISNSRADAEAVDAAIVTACEKAEVRVVSGVVPPRQPRATTSPPPRKRAREDAQSATDGETETAGDGGDGRGKSVRATPSSDSEDAALRYFRQMRDDLGSERAVGFVKWLVEQTKNASRAFPDSDVSDFTMTNSAILAEEYEEET